MGEKDVLTSEQYLTLRKVLADIVWYRHTDRIDELSVQVKKHSKQEIYLHNNSEKTVMKLVEANHKAGISELISAASNLSSISEDTLESVKVWADMCFYKDNPKAFEMLVASTFNEGTKVKAGPLEFDSSSISDEDAFRGDITRRMLYYNSVPCGIEEKDVAFLASPGAAASMFYTAYKAGEPMNDLDAMLMYDIFVNQNVEDAHRKGSGVDPHKVESDIYREYIGDAFDDETLMTVVDGDMTTAKQPEDNCLATHMSRLSYSVVSQPEDIRKKNEFFREVFDTVMTTGEVPAAVTLKNSGRRETLRSFVADKGASELLQVLDAAYFMNTHDRERKEFIRQRRLCDAFALRQEVAVMQNMSKNDEMVISDDAFGVREMEEKDVPPEWQ